MGGTQRPGTDQGRRGGERASRGRTEVERAVGDLLSRSDSFTASAVSGLVTSVGDRTVRRHLAAMVKEGRLSATMRGRSTTYHAGNATGAA